VADVLTERPRCNPKRALVWREEHETSARRNELRRARLLSVVVAIGKRERARVGAVG